ncbi:DNA-binding transcriptional LysR family regulator [Lacrimispora xylanisolvens]|uniref:DNA-binding transcriptional LysR family regulator n=1 Tax=Lacrimispora xylanisolvens TaxID=384636 RepID=A0A2S6HT92_9FIRM|nr:LysR family transcriptional regulator [Hungatella xylanolytica]PPK80975.1 DNA-binding transcriptional LysR family regulator [Hungatella xylanolytica]
MTANFEHYKIFYYVAKYKNLTRAANALVTSQPSVTYCMQNLENILGCKLFIRSRKGVTLTAEGEMLYSYVAPACQQLIQGEEKLRELLGEQHEYINVGATQMAMLSYLVASLKQFQEQYIQVKINIFNYNTPQTLNELKAGKIDLAIITTPFDHEQSLKVVKVKDFNSVLVGGPMYKEYEGRVVYLEEVGKLPLITMSENTTTFQFFQEFYRSCGLTMRPSIEVASMDLILPIILKNLGIGFVPEEFARPLVEKGEIVEIKLYEHIPQRDICIVSDSKRPLSAAAKKLQCMLESRE